MALGGGTFLTQNKTFPGSYINFVSTGNSSTTFGERGTAAIGMELDWAKPVTDGVLELTAEEFTKNCKKYFAHEYSDDCMMCLRDFFKNGKTAIIYAINGDAVYANAAAAKNAYARALCFGARGNDFSIRIEANADDEDAYDVYTSLDGTDVDCQTVSDWADLEKNDYVYWLSGVTLAEVEDTALTGGDNGTITASNVQNFLNDMDSYSFNVLMLDSAYPSYQQLVVEYTKTRRDDYGVKFQAVVPQAARQAYNGVVDYEGVVCVQNSTYLDSTMSTSDYTNKLLYWVAGALAGCAVNKSLTNKKYDGEFWIYADISQAMLEKYVNKWGCFMFHKVGDEVRVLLDINSLVTYTDEKSEIFRDNQTIRVCDQIANDIASIFNKSYLGLVQNDKAGRISFWGEIVKYMKQLQTLRAIEDFTDSDVTVEIGETKGAVVVNMAVTVVSTMSKLYMTVQIN